jgi:hypothetical protein
MQLQQELRIVKNVTNIKLFSHAPMSATNTATSLMDPSSPSDAADWTPKNPKMKEGLAIKTTPMVENTAVSISNVSHFSLSTKEAKMAVNTGLVKLNTTASPRGK